MKFMQSCQDDLIIPNTFKDRRNVEALNGDEKEAWKTKEQEMSQWLVKVRMKKSLSKEGRSDRAIWCPFYTMCVI